MFGVCTVRNRSNRNMVGWRRGELSSANVIIIIIIIIIIDIIIINIIIIIAIIIIAIIIITMFLYVLT
jgi:hypothetical protein